ncbi:2OG-Fe(II) oxygenase [Acidocella sp.]|uniref:2OG-Fe(II) oxygenase n=1 Tax=Acidocella sp. TaxID=50710 RepID=UPI002616D729|nr:2OG-Fe(II) oxygenase [Acidocella sp.]
MDCLDFDALRAAPVSDDPFTHVLLARFIRPEALAEVIKALPAMKGRGSFPIGALKLGAAARAAIAGLESDEFREIVAAKFGLDLRNAPHMITLRGNSGAQDGRIHTDSVAKRVTILLYLNQADGPAWAQHDGCLRLLRGPDDLEDYAKEVPPVEGTLLIFPNGPTTWHGHKPHIGQRYVLQMNYMTTSAKAKAEMRRHHLSALVKRLTGAA